MPRIDQPLSPAWIGRAASGHNTRGEVIPGARNTYPEYAAAGLMASFIWTCDEYGWSGEELRYGALAVTVVAGLLMVSRIRYNSFKGSGSGPKSDRVPFFALLIAVAVLIALWIEPPVTLLVAATAYALSGPVLWFRRRKLPQEGA